MLNLKKIDFEIMDALSDGPYFESFLYSEKYSYELTFNRAWHGDSVERVRERVGLMLSMGYLERAFLPNGIAVMGLTKLGGGIWESKFCVNWGKYCDVIDVVSDGVCIESLVCFISKGMALKFIDLYNYDDIGAIRMGNNWEWSNWKTHYVYFYVNVINSKNRNVILSIINDLRRGWRLPLESDFSKS